MSHDTPHRFLYSCEHKELPPDNVVKEKKESFLPTSIPVITRSTCLKGCRKRKKVILDIGTCNMSSMYIPECLLSVEPTSHALRRSSVRYMPTCVFLHHQSPPPFHLCTSPP